MAKLGKKITTLKQLHTAAKERKSVFCRTRMPASFVMGMQGNQIMHMINIGMYVYVPNSKSNRWRDCNG